MGAERTGINPENAPGCHCWRVKWLVYCVYNPRSRTGETACPFNFMYWDFLARHYEKLKNNSRMTQILRNLERISLEELKQIRQQAEGWRIKHQNTKYPLPSTPAKHGAPDSTS